MTNHYKHVHFRTRECECPKEGDKCEGSHIEIKECETDCVAIWTPWCPWSRCIVQDFDCITAASGRGVCHGFEFRTRSCFRELINNNFSYNVDSCKGNNCTCEADEYGTVAKETRACSTRNCLQIKFGNRGDDQCRPQWRFEIDNTRRSNHDNLMFQQGGYLGEDCIPVLEDINYLLIVNRGCGKVSWHFRGKEVGSHVYDKDMTTKPALADYREKKFKINIHIQD